MGKVEKGDILRVSATSGDIKKGYGLLSKFYSPMEGKFEKGPREKGLELLSVKEGEIVRRVPVSHGTEVVFPYVTVPLTVERIHIASARTPITVPCAIPSE